MSTPTLSCTPPGGADAVRFPDVVVATRELTKTFGRGEAARTVVDRLDLRIPRGVVYGFLGPNGSGKSTTMKMLLGLLTPTSGSVSLFGLPLDQRSRGGLMARIGSMIEQPPGYGHLTGAENMRLVQRMLGLSDAHVDRALDLVRLTGHRDRLVKTYSMGMKQRLGIAMALARRPELLILDEPTNGLDPAGIEEIRRLLISLAGEGVTVMVSSHLLDEIDRMASVLGILSAGKLVFQGTRAELMRRSVPDLLLATPRPEAITPALLEGLGASGPALTSEAGVRVAGLSPDAAAELVRRLVAADIPVHELRRETHSLEDVFIDLTGGAGAL
ncbi:ABC transporter ATP-binding protein [Actinomyces sp. MRS3W]|uniref:ABC transporter ATP-binding protein n=1 Tax=Actinomyces sp. MRS3W TaxID=2800796 RepID=UPI0028FD5833|nr:ABC transporter ATP-binding protein [Actinomyces sp. MRS3W]MDU0349077.1 ABC transporter ATP-binding protein [Actinomyces sp. MRS3W]